MPSIPMLSAPAGGGRFTPVKPTLTYAGSGLTNMGKFTITNHDATYIYTATGGTVASNVLTVTATTGSATLTAKAPKGLTDSAGVIAERKAPTQTFIVTTPFQCYGCPSPGFGAPCCAPGPCGCGTFHASGFDYSGFWACCEAGYYVYDNYAGSGYTWGGSDYTNGQGEWWKIT
jgi:hypothetical protein